MEKLSFWSATLIGIGAIVGGGVFVLGGVALAEAGAGATFAFTLNGCIALMTATSFAKLCQLFPESGGIYVYAKRLLSVRSAFFVGWMLWLAYIVAALLYALGFAAYAASILTNIFPNTLPLFSQRWAIIMLSAFITAIYSWLSFRKFRSDAKWTNIIKLTLFIGLIVAGCGILAFSISEQSMITQSEFIPYGWSGIFSAMGFTFIALQGFELIAASAGEIEDPKKTVPKAMYMALTIALLVYIPIFMISIALGIPDGVTAHEWCAVRKETCVVDVTLLYLGRFGYWIVSFAALFAMLSALQANIIASASIARTMAQDQTMPGAFASISEKYGSPEVAISVNFVILIILMLLLPNTAAAGSAASLAFLICYSFSHGFTILALRRADKKATEALSYRRYFLPIAGGLSCISLSVFQMLVEQNGGAVLITWITAGAILYYLFLSSRAETLDAFSQAQNPKLFSYRGHAPIVLVPVSNPESARALAQMAQALCPRTLGHILLLSVAATDAEEDLDSMREKVSQASRIVSDALLNTIRAERRKIEAIVSVNRDPWTGIYQVAQTYDCETLLIGFTGEDSKLPADVIDRLLRILKVNVVIMKARADWQLSEKTKVLVPVGGKGMNNQFRARLLGRLARVGVTDIQFLRIVPHSVSSDSLDRLQRSMEQKVTIETRGIGKLKVHQSDDVEEGIIEHCDDNTLLILGLTGEGVERDALGGFVATIAKSHNGATLIIRRGH